MKRKLKKMGDCEQTYYYNIYENYEEYKSNLK